VDCGIYAILWNTYEIGDYGKHMRLVNCTGVPCISEYKS